MLLRARIVMPVSRPPIEDGAALIENNRIVAVRPWKRFDSAERVNTTDLGEVVLLPGLVNAHCHLDYTDMAGLIPPGRNFPDWIKAITALKAEWSYTDFAESWLHGAKMLLRTGTTTVADIEAVPELLPEVWTATPLRAFSFIEMIAVRRRHSARQILSEADEFIQTLPSSRGGAAFSPHAPYTTTPDLLKRTAELVSRRHSLMAVHVAESAAEFNMYQHACGPMFDWLKPQRDMDDCDGISPIQHLDRSGALGRRVLAVHANYLAPGDAQLLARRGTSVVHCPRSHAFFGHRPFPLDELDAAGVNICLGTDSLATVIKPSKRHIELDQFAEMRTLASSSRGLAPERILQMATVNGARALGLGRRIGELSQHAYADLIAIGYSGPIKSAAESLVGEPTSVRASMIDGEWAIAPGA